MKIFKVILFALLAVNTIGSTTQEIFERQLMAMITERFNQVVAEVRNFPKEDHLADSEKSVPIETRLKMYALYKQATEGDCPEESTDNTPVGLLKHQAWGKEKGLDKGKAMVAYNRKYDEITKTTQGPSA